MAGAPTDSTYAPTRSSGSTARRKVSGTKNRLETGVVSINDLRAEMELPPIKGEGGDDHFVSANLIKVGSPKLSGDATPAPEPKEDKKKGGAQ